MTLFDPSPEPIAEPGLEPVRLRMTVAYDGAAFHGFALSDGVPTVAEVLASKLQRSLQVPSIDLVCAGRTDAGVHAWGQVVSFDIPRSATKRKAFDLDTVQRTINKIIGPEVVIREIGLAAPDFDARASARARLYRYTIVNRPWPDPFLARTAWHVVAPLDLRAMTLACDPFIGGHDFTSFCRKPKSLGPDGEPKSLIRRVRSARWEDAGDGILYFWIEANAFCHQMVRSITGTIVEVGRGKKRAGDVLGIIRAQDRRAAGDLAPPHGLCLWHVTY